MRYSMLAAALVLLGTSGHALAMERSRVQIQPAHSGKCLDVTAASQSPGAQIIQFPCVKGNANQRWTIHKVGTSPLGDIHTIKPVHVSGMCMDVSGGSSDDGAGIIQFPCLGQANQHFIISSDKNGFRIKPSHKPEKCLDVEGASPFENARLIQFACIPGNRNQQFNFVK